MRVRRLFESAGVLLACVALGCNAPGRPKPGPEVPRPETVLEFDSLYKQNCAACHGDNGVHGPSIALANPVYLGVAGEATLTQVVMKGVAGTSMPAFGHSAGGMLTDQQIQSLVHGMLTKWGGSGVPAGVSVPAYAASGPGDAAHGAQVFTTYCARCHGADGAGPATAGGEGHVKGSGEGSVKGSIVDPTYLALVSDQSLRTITIAGMPDRGMPDWRGHSGSPVMSEQEITDVVAWLSSHRTKFPGQPYPQSSPVASTSGDRP